MSKNSYLTDFEGIILRHDYLKRSTFEKELFEEYKHLAFITAGEMFSKYWHFYSRISYHKEDVEQLCLCYLVSYLSLYSIAKGDYNKKDERNRIIRFLRSQCNSSMLVVKRKSRNVIGNADTVHFFAITEDSLPIVDKNVLIENHEKYGYRKVRLKEFNEIKGKDKMRREIKDKDGFPIVVVQNLANSFLEHTTLDDEHYIQDPEELYTMHESEMELCHFEQMYEKEGGKEAKLKSFINCYKGNVKYKEEVKEARRQLKDMV